jgi:hypothetical protein
MIAHRHRARTLPVRRSYARGMRTLRRRVCLAALLALSACAAGPHQLRRSIDDWDHKSYVNSPWWNAALWVVPVFPLCYAGAFVGDFLVTDPWAFWLEDAWDGKGTGFEHLPVQWTDGRMTSLWLERTGWTRIEK